MKTTTILSEGARQVFRFRKLIGLFYLANLTAALVVVLPVAAALRSQLARSMESDRLFVNIDPAWFTEMFLKYGTVPFAAFGVTAAAVAVLFLLLSTFLAGGAMAVFHREGDSFFAAAARYFPRLVRLLLIGLLLYGLVVAFNGAITSVINRLKENSMEAGPWAMLHWARILLILFLFGVVNMIVDYSRIACVVENRRSAIKGALKGMRFVLAHPRRTLAIYWLCTLIGLLFLLAYHGLSELIGQNSAAAVILLFFVRQFYVVTRLWTRLWTWSSEVAYYTIPAPLPVTEIPETAPEPPALAATS